MKEINYAALGKRVKEVREEYEFTRPKMCRVFDVTYPTYYSWEKGTVRMSGPAKRLFCLLFNLNKEWLETGEGEKYKKDAPKFLFVPEFLMGENVVVGLPSVDAENK